MEEITKFLMLIHRELVVIRSFLSAQCDLSPEHREELAERTAKELKETYHEMDLLEEEEEKEE